MLVLGDSQGLAELLQNFRLRVGQNAIDSNHFQILVRVCSCHLISNVLDHLGHEGVESVLAPGLEQERVVLVLLIRFPDRLHHIFVRAWVEVPDPFRREVG